MHASRPRACWTLIGVTARASFGKAASLVRESGRRYASFTVWMENKFRASHASLFGMTARCSVPNSEWSFGAKLDSKARREDRTFNRAPKQVQPNSFLFQAAERTGERRICAKHTNRRGLLRRQQDRSASEQRMITLTGSQVRSNVSAQVSASVAPIGSFLRSRPDCQFFEHGVLLEEHRRRDFILKRFFR